MSWSASLTYHELVFLKLVGDLGNSDGTRHFVAFASGAWRAEIS